MKFWDASAVLPLCLEEPRSADLRRLAQEDPQMVTWWGTSVECASALARLHREGFMDASEENQVNNLLRSLTDAWTELQPTEELRRFALRFLRYYPLRAADALQLAAAYLWSASRPANYAFVSLDRRLREAALREGFLVLPELPNV